jgi:hypothetical protein
MTGFCAYSGMSAPIISIIALRALMPDALSDASIPSTSTQGKSKVVHHDDPS